MATPTSEHVGNGTTFPVSIDGKEGYALYVPNKDDSDQSVLIINVGGQKIEIRGEIFIATFVGAINDLLDR